MVMTSEEQTREYTILRAKTCLLNGDSSYAKCWIMTANALFPQNDKIKFEAYEMCRCECRVEEANKYFCEMFATNQFDEKLIDEIKKIIISIRNEWQTYHLTEQQINSIFGNQFNTNKSLNSNQFYYKLFSSLSPQYQYKLLKTVIDLTEDQIVSIDLWLFTLKKFPESVVENGIKLIEIMDENNIKLNKYDSIDSSNLNNYLNKKLVFDVLPIIFSPNSNLVLNFELTQKLMQKSLRYLVEQVIQSDLNDNELNKNINNKTKENPESIESKIIEIFQFIGNKNEWKLFHNIDFSYEKQSEVVYDKISRFIDEYRYSGDTDSPMDLSSATTAKISGDEKTSQQILYATLLLFLQCLRRYTKLSNEMVLIEQTNASLSDTKITICLNKKRKIKLSEPELVTNHPDLKPIFVVASKALKLLHENLTINKDFITISEIIGLSGCQSFQSFIIDSDIYKAEYNQVLSTIINQKINNLKSNLQLISVSLMLHDYSATLKYCLDSIEFLPHKSTNLSKETLQTKASHESGNCSRHLFFLPLNVNDIINYIIEVIILCLKDRVILSLKPSDLGVGHLIVLSQYVWPNYVDLFLTCMSCIRNGAKTHSSQSQPKFVYQYFFNYIFIPEIIEEFMSIVETKDILLELKTTNTSIGTPMKTSSKIITTRGVNKGFKEENKSALVQQMKTSKTQIPNDLFIDFINKEIRAFLTHFNK